MVAALQNAHVAKTPEAIEAADATVKERLYLIGKDGVNGPTIDQLREETTANFNGAGGEHFKDAVFVDAAKEWHEANLLAEACFTGSQEQPLEQRYVCAKSVSSSMSSGDRARTRSAQRTAFTMQSLLPTTNLKTR